MSCEHRSACRTRDDPNGSRAQVHLHVSQTDGILYVHTAWVRRPVGNPRFGVRRNAVPPYVEGGDHPIRAAQSCGGRRLSGPYSDHPLCAVRSCGGRRPYWMACDQLCGVRIRRGSCVAFCQRGRPLLVRPFSCQSVSSCSVTPVICTASVSQAVKAVSMISSRR